MGIPNLIHMIGACTRTSLNNLERNLPEQPWGGGGRGGGDVKALPNCCREKNCIQNLIWITLQLIMTALSL